jgi:flagellar protein FliO/FliZ
MDDFGNMIFAFFGICAVLLLAYYGTRIMAKYYKNYNGGKNLQMLERMNMGKEKSVAVIKVKDSIFLVGITDHNISLLSELPELTEKDFKKEPAPDFNAILMQKLKEKNGMLKNKRGEGK